MRSIEPWVPACATLLTILLAVAPSAPAAGPEPVNLITNPGFESLDEHGMPTSWHISQHKEALSVDRTNAAAGKHSIHFKLDGQSVRFQQEKEFPILPGGTYTLRASVKTKNFRRKSPYGLLLVNNGWTWASAPLKIDASNSDWRDYSVRFNIPPLEGKSRLGRITMYWQGDEGDIWVDVLRLEADETDYQAAAGPIAGGTMPELVVTMEAPKAMTTGDMALVTLRVKVPGKVVRNEKKGCFIDRVELHKFERDTGGQAMTPRRLLAKVTNQDKTAREFTARFTVTSPEPGTQYYGIWTGYGSRWSTFAIEVIPKTVPLGEKASIKVTTALPADVQDSQNYLERIELYECRGTPTFDLDEKSRVRTLTNRRELLSARGGKITGARNPDMTSTVFRTELAVGPETTAGTATYLIRTGKIKNRTEWHIVTVYFEN